MTRVLVTGAAGFIGGHLLAYYAKSGASAVGLARRSTQSNTALGLLLEPSEHWGEVIAELKPDIVFHCAGFASVPRSIDDPLGDFLAGPALTAALLERLRRDVPAAAFIFVSSAAVYGQPDRLPIHETTPPDPISPYGYHKLQSELSCLAYNRIFGIRTAAARVFSAYGPGLRRQVVWDMIQKARSGPLHLRGNGKESRDFIHVDDLVSALDLIARKGSLRGEAYNVAAGIEVPIPDLARTISEAVGRSRVPITFDGQETPGMPARWLADITRLCALGFAPKVALRDGIAGLANAFDSDQS